MGRRVKFMVRVWSRFGFGEDFGAGAAEVVAVEVMGLSKSRAWRRGRAK